MAGRGLGAAGLALALLVATCVAMAGCAPGGAKGPEPGRDARVITDGAGREVAIPRTVESVVCLGASALRFTAYLEALPLVAGVERNEQEPAVLRPYQYLNRQLFADLPVIGDNGEPYHEELVRLGPDVVVAAMDGDGADRLQAKLGIPVVAAPLVDQVFAPACYRALALLGEVYGKEERARELTAYLQAAEADLGERTAQIPPQEKPSVYAGGVSFKGHHGFEGTEGGYPPFAAIGANNLADQTGRQGPFNIDLEQVLRWDPELIFLDYNGMALIARDWAANPDYYRSLTAVREGRVYGQISFRYSAVNVELALADAYYAGAVIFPRQFADVDPVERAEEIFQMFLGASYYPTLREHGYEFKEVALGELGG